MRSVRRYIVAVVSVMLCHLSFAQQGEKWDSKVQFWWPEQKVPKGVVICKALPGNLQEQMLAQSLAGLAARSVNSGEGDEMVWMRTTNSSYAKWYKQLVSKLKVEERGAFDVWSLVERYRKSGVIKGYILYKADESAGGIYHERENINMSVNVATAYAGVYQGVLIDESMRSKAKSLGLDMLFDARNVTPEKCFADLKTKLFRSMLVCGDPKAFNNRDMAIAHGAMFHYGVGELLEEILEWMNPVSPVVGWNLGDESGHTAPASEWGHFNTASDWCQNLTLLSAGARNTKILKPKRFDDSKIDWKDKRSMHSFVMSDGDNMQWSIGNFINNPSYWGSPLHGKFPMSWTMCPFNLAMMAPDVWNEMVRSKPSNVSMVEYGGGYQYPDLFAKKRANREHIQRQFARMCNQYMEQTGVYIFGLICKNIFSEDTRKACEIYAEEMENLEAIIAVQYAPYQKGDGDIIWVKNKKGKEIPVITAKYSLWANLKGERVGGPTIIADLINTNAKAAKSGGKKNLDWTVVHAWSKYQKESDGSIVDIKKGEAGEKGVTPVNWCVDRIDKKNVKVVSLEELICRIKKQKENSK